MSTAKTTPNPDPTYLTAGVHYGVPHDTYLSDPVEGGSLSTSGAKLLLPPNCPAIYRELTDHPPKPKQVFDIGTAAHRLVLGDGPELVALPFPDRRAAGWKAAAAAVRADGGVPLPEPEAQVVNAMADQIRRHALARTLLDPEHGTAEVTFIWKDDDTGVNRRARLDWLRRQDGRRAVIVDYKTAASAHPEKFKRAAGEHGYHLADDAYRAAVRATGIDSSPAFVFIVQEKTAPYVVNVIALDEESRHAGRLLNRRALTTYARCVERNEWPGYGEDITTVQIPTYHLIEAQEGPLS